MSLLGPIVSLCIQCLLLTPSSSISVRRGLPASPSHNSTSLNCRPECSNANIIQNSIVTNLSNETQSAPLSKITSLNLNSSDTVTNKTNDSALFNISSTQKPLVDKSATSVTGVPLFQTENNELSTSAAVVPSTTTVTQANLPKNTTGTTSPTTHPSFTTTSQMPTGQASKTAQPSSPSTEKTSTHAPITTPPVPKTNATTISPSTSSKQNTKKPVFESSTASTATTTAPPLSPVVDVPGGVLTKQLLDKASLFAILLFGLLFFFVVVAVFLTQACESYKRKDYTQVDYLINGMYTDSGV